MPKIAAGSQKIRIEFEDKAKELNHNNSTNSNSNSSDARRFLPEKVNLSAQKSLWNDNSIALEKEGKNADTSPPNSDYLRLFMWFYPPNMLSNSLKNLHDLQLLPGSKVGRVHTL